MYHVFTKLTKTILVFFILVSITLADSIGNISPSINTPRIQPRPVIPDGPDIIVTYPIIEEVPKEAQQYKFVLKKLDVDGAFGEIQKLLPEYYKNYINQEITVADLFKIAQKIQYSYHRQGYFLVQVFVPAQTIEKGVANINIIEAYISKVDVSDLPVRYQDKTREIFSSLLNSNHILRQQVERKLLLVNSLPGLTIETTLIPGDKAGSTILVVQGKSKLFSAYLTSDNYASPPLREWQGLLSFSLNSLFGLGEEFVVQTTFHPSLKEIDREQRIRSSGSISVNLPVGSDGLKVNLNAIRSVTHPKGELTPLSLRGRLNSWSTGITFPYLLSRKNAIEFNAMYDYIDEVLQTDLFGPRINITHDSLRILRFGTTWNHKEENGFQSTLNGRISQGLNALGARDVPNGGTALSRSLGKVDFTKIEAYSKIRQPLPEEFRTEFQAKIQWSPNDLLVPEQFTLGGPDFGSGQSIGSVLGDYGFAVRAELQKDKLFNLQGILLNAEPYLFTDYGRAWIRSPTAAESNFTSVANAGIGLRISFFEHQNSLYSGGAFLEYARQLNGPPGDENGDKFSLRIIFSF